MALKKLIPSLTALRFLFALMVFCSHLQVNPLSPIGRLLLPYMREGFLGVSFFFILSGFILAYNYEDKILSGSVSRRNFYVARLARIWPLHIVTLLAVLPLFFLNNNDVSIMTALRFLCNASLIQSLIPERSFFFSFNVPSWSISDEMVFYLLFPFIIVYLQSRKRAGMAIYFIIFIASLFLFHLYANKATQRAFFYVNPALRTADFLIGILLYRVYNQSRTLNKVMDTRIAGLFEFLSLMMLGVFFLLHKHIPEIFRFSFYYWLPMIAVILSFAYSRGVISKFLSARIFVFLGEISFSFYMVHHIVIDYVAIFTSAHPEIHYMLIACLNFFVAILLSYATYKWIEVPAARAIKARYSL